MQNLLVDMSIVIIVATIGGLIAKLFKQPLIPAYIIMGVLLGPLLGLVKDASNMMMLSEIGVAFLLFIVGLELDLHKLKDVGDVATIGGAVQAVLMFGIGYGAALLLGFSTLPALYFGLVMSFSSTMVVIKMLGDRHELDTLHGRIVIGILLLQDILAIVALSMLQATDGLGSLLVSFAIGVAIIVASFFLGKALFPPLFRHAAKSLELLFLLAVSVCFFFALLFAQLGFSIAIGAFIAGVILGNLPYSTEIIGRVRPLKDFFTVLFFTSIGLQVSFDGMSSMVAAFVVFFLLTVLVSPLLMIAVCSLFGYKKRTTFLAGINLSQISEFALILATAGLAAGQLSQQAFSLILFLTVATIAASSYLIKYEQQLYRLFSPVLEVFERFSPMNRELENMSEESTHDTILVGYDRTGYSIFHALRRLKRDIVVVDFDPDVIRHLMERNVPCIYGDIGDPEVLEKLKLHQVKLVISTIPNHQENLLLIRRVRAEHTRTAIIVTSYQPDEALELYDAGADYVVIPHFLGGERVSVMLEDVTTNLDTLLTAKIEHIKELRMREEIRPKRR